LKNQYEEKFKSMTLELAELKYNANKKPDWNAELALKENK